MSFMLGFFFGWQLPLAAPASCLVDVPLLAVRGGRTFPWEEGVGVSKKGQHWEMSCLAGRDGKHRQKLGRSLQNHL